MVSFNDLPDELLVKIFCSLDDHDATKIRLERVSQRFYGCLRESWKHSDCFLDLDLFDTINGSAAFLARVQEITHLRLSGPEHYEPEILQQLYQNAHKMRVSELEYQSWVEEGESNLCFTNAQLIIWCLSTCGGYLQTLDFQCCDGVTCCNDGALDISCRTLDALVRLLPSCHNLQHVYLSKIDQTSTRGDLLDALSKLEIKTLTLTDVGDSDFQYCGLVRLLNNCDPAIESVSVEADQKDDVFEEFLIDLPGLDKDSGLELRTLEVPIFDFDSVQLLATIQNFLPKLRDLTVNFDWRSFDKKAEENDAKNLTQVIAEFISLGKRKEFEICFDLTVKRKRESEYNFGEDFINRLLALTGASMRVKRNRDASKWEVKIVDENVKVCIHTSIDDLYAQRKEEERAKKQIYDWLQHGDVSDPPNSCYKLV